MSRNKGKKADRVSPPPAGTRHKRRNFTAEVYGARLPFEDARIIDDYAKANNLDRSEVVRQGLHHFALRQQMRYHKKDPLRESLEQVVAEQIAPVRERTEEMAALLRDLTNFIVEQGQNQPARSTTGADGAASPTVDNSMVAAHTARILAEHKGLLEQTLMAVMLGLRLLVDYLIDPVLSASERRAGDEVEQHLQAAILGRERWCMATHKVFARTGKRILFESNLMTQEEWKNLLAGYHAEDQKAGAR